MGWLVDWLVDEEARYGSRVVVVSRLRYGREKVIKTIQKIARPFLCAGAASALCQKNRQRKEKLKEISSPIKILNQALPLEPCVATISVGTVHW